MVPDPAARLAERPGDDAAHEALARTYLAVGRINEALVEAQNAVRLDPDEIRYRELLAQILSASGAHRDAAEEYARLAELDPRLIEWARAEAAERLAAGDVERAIAAARRAVRLDETDGAAQLTLARALLRAATPAPPWKRAERALILLPGDPAARAVEADALWLAGYESRALSAYAALARDGRP